MRDLELLIDLCDVVKNTSLCGLGMTAPNPVLSTLRYFKRRVPGAHREQALPGRSVRLRQQSERSEGSGMAEVEA